MTPKPLPAPAAPLFRPLVAELALAAPPAPKASETPPAATPHSGAAAKIAALLATTRDSAASVTRGSGLLTARPGFFPLNRAARRAQARLKKDYELPKPRYANFQEFRADMKNHDWTEKGTLVILTRHGESVFNRMHDLFYGSLDSPLVDAGKRQAERLGEALRIFPIRAIYASPIARARDTAEIVRQKIGFTGPVALSDDLIEIPHGILDAYPRDMNSAQFDAFLKRMEDPAARARLAALYSLAPGEVDYALARCRARRALIQNYCAQNGLTEDEAIREAREGLISLDHTPAIDGESFVDAKEIRCARVCGFLDSAESEPGAILIAAHGMLNKTLLLERLDLDMVSRKQLSKIDQDNCGINVLWRDKATGKWRLLVLNGQA